MTPLRTVVVGLGRIGWQFHLQQVAAQPGYELAGVVDPLQERRAEAASEFDATGWAHLDACLAAAHPDLVVLASPTPFHREQAEAAFAAGAHVFCDKPMAPDLAQADAMIEAARAHDRKLMVYQPQRGSREVVALQGLLARGLIGPVYLIKHTRTLYTRRHDWQAFTRHGGGMLNNYGAHLIDACLHVAASPATRITCRLRTIASLGDADDVVKALIETESGTLLDIDINMATAHPMLPRWHVCGEHGSLILDDEAQAWKARWYSPADLPTLAAAEQFAAPERRYGSGEQIPWREESYPLEGIEAVDVYARAQGFFAGAGAPVVPLSESRELMRVLAACRADAEGTGPA